MSESDNRYAPLEVIEAYRTQSVSGTLLVDGAPPSRISIAPQQTNISLLVQAVDGKPGPDLRGWENLDYELVKDDGILWHRLTVTYGLNLTEVYPVLCSILDRVQMAGESFAAAVNSVLAGLGDILANRRGLSHEQQVGLFGELIGLLSLASYESAPHAVAAWRGHAGEEHDFGLADSDVEVKTTLSETRRHWISSLTQLLPTGARSLYLLSTQITAAGQAPGATLAALVQSARALPDVPSAELERALEASGYFDRHADLYLSRWTLRTQPAFFRIDDSFPALTPATIAASVPRPERITDLRYRINLSGLEPAPDLFPVSIAEVFTQ